MDFFYSKRLVKHYLKRFIISINTFVSLNFNTSCNVILYHVLFGFISTLVKDLYWQFKQLIGILKS